MPLSLMNFLTGVTPEEVVVVLTVVLLFVALVLSNPPKSQEIERI
jgi:hypothetical protein